MPRRSVEVEGLHHGGQPFPMASVVGNLVQTSAIHAMNPRDGSFASTAGEQVAQAFENVGLVMAAAGGSMEDVIGVEVLLADGGMREMVNRYWVEVFPDSASRPVRHTHVLPLREPLLVQLKVTGMLAGDTRLP